jgi:octaprenyl-diphosphate synthase
MLQYKDEALELLSTYPDSDYKGALELMVNYVVDRKK